MTDAKDPIKQRLRELERSFNGFERGERNRLYESRDSLLGLAEAVEVSGFESLTPLCEISSRLLGLLLMEGGLDEGRSVQFVRELLGYIEGQLQVLHGNEESTPGGVFHVVNSEKVGEILVRRELIAPHQLEEALLLQRVSKGKRVGEVLVAMNAIDHRTLKSVLESQKGETRRAETRRSGTPGQPSIHLTPLPPFPGAPGASAPAAPGLSMAPEPFAPPPQPGPAPLRLSESPQPIDPHAAARPVRDASDSLPFSPPPAPEPFPAPPRQDSGSPFEHPEAS